MVFINGFTIYSFNGFCGINVVFITGGNALDPAHGQEMRHVGELLRNRRKEMNLSLKEAENATSIRTAYLQALEEGEMSKLISPIYAQGFCKQYAFFLGLDGEQIVRMIPKFLIVMECKSFPMELGPLKEGATQVQALNGFQTRCGS